MFANASIARNECESPDGLEPHQTSVVQEKAELDAKLAALRAFIKGDVYKTMDSQEQVRLSWQANHMDSYSSVLADRIAAFKPASPKSYE